jgi:hypothetical protein
MWEFSSSIDNPEDELEVFVEDMEHPTTYWINCTDLFKGELYSDSDTEDEQPGDQSNAVQKDEEASWPLSPHDIRELI